MVQQAEVGHDAQRHLGVDAGLEFEQDVEVEPAVFEPHAPDDVVLAAAQVVGDIAAVDFLERAECFETHFGPPPTGRNMPTPGGRITPTRDTSAAPLPRPPDAAVAAFLKPEKCRGQVLQRQRLALVDRAFVEQRVDTGIAILGPGLEFEPPVVAGAGTNVAARCAVRLAGCRAGKRVNFSQWLSFSKAWMLRNELRLMSTLFLFLPLSGNLING